MKALLQLSLALMLCGPAFAQCRQALALGLDVSGSVDTREYRLQMDGLAAALLDPEVVQAIMAMPSAPVRIAIFEWSGPEYQRLILDWTEIKSTQTLRAAADALETARRSKASPGTALGAAMEVGAALLAQQTGCWKRTLDLSGDGKHNLGPHPKTVRDALKNASLTINALVIGADAPGIADTRQVEIGELSSYFNAYVKTGPGAFVETAIGFEDYQAAMIRKLKRELEGLVVSSLSFPH